MARDDIPGALLHPRRCIVEHAPGHLGHTPARIATDVLVVVLSHLVVRLAVAQIDAPDRALALHRRDGAKHARVVGRAQRSAHDFMQLVDGPRMSRLAVEHAAHGVGDRAGSGHIEIITR